MATDGNSAALAVRSNTGLDLYSSAGLKVPYALHPQFVREASKFCRAAVFSPDGRYLAWTNGQVVNICSTADWSIAQTLPRPKACFLKFSPNGNYLMTYESFATSKDCPNGSNNLFVYDANTGEEKFASIQKKQSGWEPAWSQDESIMALMVGGEAIFYEPASAVGLSKQSRRAGNNRNGTLSVAPNPQQPFVAFCVPGVKGNPSQCKIFKYPDLQAAQPVAFKSYFQADSVEMLWNKRGTGLLLLTSTDVDQTGASYYGKQALHFMSTRGDSYSVQLSKEGSVHAVSWNPNSTEFCVVYGFMPAKCTFYNLKCDAICEVGEGERNSIYYNTFGTIVILAGFGNLSGKLDIWDVAKKKAIANIRAPDTTHLEWCPNGELFVTATTAPRLRVGNGFKVWHYSGSLLHETFWPTGQELYNVSWQTFASGVHTARPISATKVEGIKSSQPIACAEPYRPPGARGMGAPLPAGVSSPHAASNGAVSNTHRSSPAAGGAAAAGGGAGGEFAAGTDAAGAATNRKDRRTERNKARATNFRKKFENGTGSADSPSPKDPSSVSAPELSSTNPFARQRNNNTPAANTNSSTNGTPVSTVAENATTASVRSTPQLSADELVRLKRTRIIAKKLSDIGKLKARKERGEHLEVNQVAKITSEADLQKELADLKLA